MTIEDVDRTKSKVKSLRHHNKERPHSGKYFYGKTPMKTFQESKHLAQVKELDNEKWWARDSANRTSTTT